MSATMIATRDVLPRVRGFLASCFLEVSSGVYFSNQINPKVRQRILDVLMEWYEEKPQGGVVILWPNNEVEGGLEYKVIGQAPRELVNLNGVIVGLKRS